MSTELVLVSRDADVATVTLNRPEKLNALTKPMWRRLGEVINELSADDGLRCIVVRGAGDKAFAPSNDISEFENERSTSAQANDYAATHLPALAALHHCRHPLVALIHGICVGGGLEIAALCDLRICGSSSRFGIPINRLGLVAGHAELKGLLDAKSVPYREIAVDGDPGLRQEMRDRSGRYTVPQIWVGAQHIGGYDDLQRLEDQGRLDELLERGRHGARG